MSDEEDFTPNTKKTRQPRTTLDQREIFINFAEKTPSVLDNMNPSYNKSWKDVASLLNDSGPTRAVGAWILNFRNWSYNLRNKERAVFQETTATGGGPSKTKLTRFEERALRIFSKIPVTGNNVPISGIYANETDEYILDPEEEEINILGENSSGSSSSRKRKSGGGRNDDTGKILKLMEKKLEVDEKNAQTMAKMAEAFTTFAQSFAKG